MNTEDTLPSLPMVNRAKRKARVCLLVSVISKESTHDLAPLPLTRAVAAWVLSVHSVPPHHCLFSADTDPGINEAQLTVGLNFLPFLRF